MILKLFSIFSLAVMSLSTMASEHSYCSIKFPKINSYGRETIKVPAQIEEARAKIIKGQDGQIYGVFFDTALEKQFLLNLGSPYTAKEVIISNIVEENFGQKYLSVEIGKVSFDIPLLLNKSFQVTIPLDQDVILYCGN